MKKSIQNFSRKTSEEEIIWKTYKRWEDTIKMAQNK
jgi:hypothetical protein